MQKTIEKYEEVKLAQLALQPVVSGVGVVCEVLEFSYDLVEAAREDLQATADKERQISVMKLDIKLAKLKRDLVKHQEIVVEL